jgi:hypothetical protein
MKINVHQKEEFKLSNSIYKSRLAIQSHTCAWINKIINVVMSLYGNPSQVYVYSAIIVHVYNFHIR